jgi:hypothetical protein
MVGQHHTIRRTETRMIFPFLMLVVVMVMTGHRGLDQRKNG